MNRDEVLLSSQKIAEATNNKYLKLLLDLYYKSTDATKDKLVVEMLNYLTKTGLINLANNLNEFSTEGDIQLGVSKSSGAPIFIASSDLEENMLVVAASGHGKTNLIANVIKQLLSKQDRKIIVFDYKRNFISLFPIENTLYLTKETPINILQKPDFLDREEWAQILGDSLSSSLSLLVGSRSFLVSGILKAQEKNSLLNPTLLDLLYSLEDVFREKDVYKDYRDVVLSRIMYLAQLKLFRGSGQDYNKLLNNNIIVDLSSLGSLEARVLFYFLFSLIYSKGNKQPSQKYTIIVDDAHSLFDVNLEKQPEQGIPLIHQYIAKMRELGLSLILADQQISALLSSVVQNTKIKVVGKIDLAEDLSKINLNAKEISDLQRGEFLLLYKGKKEKIIVPKVSIPSLAFEEAYIDRTFEELGLKEDKEGLQRAIIFELKQNPFQSWNKVRRKLVMFSNESAIDEALNNLINSGKIGKVQISTSLLTKTTFYFLKEEYAEESFLRSLLSKLVYYKLKNMDVTFFFDGDGFVIYRPKKMYVGIMRNGYEMSKLAESFFKVYDVVEEPLSENTVLADVTDPLLLPRIVVSKIYNFDIKI
jgi:hypothetical protein